MNAESLLYPAIPDRTAGREYVACAPTDICPDDVALLPTAIDPTPTRLLLLPCRISIVANAMRASTETVELCDSLFAQSSPSFVSDFLDPCRGAMSRTILHTHNRTIPRATAIRVDHSTEHLKG